MGFFNRRKKQQQQQQQQQQQAAKGTPAAKAPTTANAEKKEPLLETEPLPADEPEVQQQQQQLQQKSSNSPPTWSNVDGTRTTDVEEGDLSTNYQLDNTDKQQNQKKSPLEYIIFTLTCCGASTKMTLAAWAAIGVAALTLGLLVGPNHVVVGNVNIAFVGNSYFFVNDLPRLMEQVTGEHIFQDSCLHGSGSLLNILKTGNGMYYKWNTQNGMINGIPWEADDGTTKFMYDYGACSVPQLLTGQDNLLSYQNQYAHYIDDGTNPCLVDNDYLDYERSFNYDNPWDYVVLVDQSKRMAFDDARKDALMAINYTYGPLIDHSGAVPIIVQPHAFWSYNVNMTGLEDLPTFTKMIMQGASTYKNFMDTKISSLFKKTRIAPVGDAYLAVLEEDYDLWNKLFLDDRVHPSGYGSYLYSMVLHATIYHVMPPKSRVVTDDTMQLFLKARKLHSNETQMPSKDEALTLWKIARKVTLLGYQPSYESAGLDDYDPYADDAQQDGNDNQEQQPDENEDEDVEYTDDAAGYQGDDDDEQVRNL